MSKPKLSSEQVRLPIDLMNDVRQTCPAFDEAPNAYVARAVRELLDREMGVAAQRLAERAALRKQTKSKR